MPSGRVSSTQNNSTHTHKEKLSAFLPQLHEGSVSWAGPSTGEEDGAGTVITHVSVSTWKCPLFTLELLDCFIHRIGEPYLIPCHSG